MKWERRALTGLAAAFLVELAIGIPAAFHRDVTDDAQATPRAVTIVPSAHVATPDLPVAQRMVAVAKLAPSPMITVAATAKPTATPTPTAKPAAPAIPMATVVPTAAATPAASARFDALQGAWQIDEANLQVGTIVWYAEAVLSRGGTIVLDAHKESVAGRPAVPCERQTDLHAAFTLGLAQQTVRYHEVNCEGAAASGEVRVGSFTRDDRSFSGSFWRAGAKLGDFDARKRKPQNFLAE